MLPALFRLQEKKYFQRVYRHGKALHTPLFRIHTYKNNLEQTRIGIVIANKVIKKATKRTRKKRQIRAAFFDLIDHLVLGYDIVVVAKPDIEKASFLDVQKDLEDGLKKIGFFR